MKVNKEDVLKIAHLARLELNPNEIEPMKESINKVLDWMEALNAVNTDHAEPLVHMTPAMNQFRADVAKQDLSKEKALALGPETNEQYFKVPQVIE